MNIGNDSRYFITSVVDSSYTTLIEGVARDARAFAQGNNIPNKDWNAIEHIHVSAQLALW